MTITISDQLLQKINVSEQELLIDFAVYLYDKNIFSMGQAKRLCSLTQLEFQKALADRNVYLNYDREAFFQDVQTLGIPKK